MLHLKSTSETRWLEQVDAYLDQILIDHAHCEHKAAATAMSLFGAYIDQPELTRAMAEIVDEELEHFHLVLDILSERGIAICRQQPGHYGRELSQLIRKNEPERGIDRLLVGGLIEARSCERFRLLSQHVADRDPKLAEFYGSLFESEARHHSTYVRLAMHFGEENVVRQRLEELSNLEAEIIGRGNDLPRMHS
jgi:tRNA-(ms[2]io[6]A)-hydroxylase